MRIIETVGNGIITLPVSVDSFSAETKSHFVAKVIKKDRSFILEIEFGGVPRIYVCRVPSLVISKLNA